MIFYAYLSTSCSVSQEELDIDEFLLGCYQLQGDATGAMGSHAGSRAEVQLCRCGCQDHPGGDSLREAGGLRTQGPTRGGFHNMIRMTMWLPVVPPML